MTTENYSIEPLPSRELVKKWIEDWAGAQMKGIPSEECMEIAAQAAQWGYKQRGAVNEAELQKARDEELEGCCEWASQFDYGDDSYYQDELRALRRPKPKSQAEEARQRLEYLIALIPTQGALAMADPIRAALERLCELEHAND